MSVNSFFCLVYETKRGARVKFIKVMCKKNARNRGRFTFFKMMGLLRYVY